VKSTVSPSDFDQLIARLGKVDRRASENDNTAQGWLPWFRDCLKCAVYFDTSASRSSKRPDLQIWADTSAKNASQFAPLWLEAKAAGELATKANKLKAYKEILEKIQREFSENRVGLPGIILSDLDVVEFWDTDALNECLKRPDIEQLGLADPLGSFRLESPKPNDVRKFTKFIERAVAAKPSEPLGLNLEELTNDLLAVTKKFQSQVLPEVFEAIGSKKYAQIYKVWHSFGGKLSLEMFGKDDSIGNEETFAELCLHTLITRLFAVKWCLDHGYLEDTQLKDTWGSLVFSNQVSTWHSIVYPEGTSEIEKLLRKVFGPTNMYMWVIDLLPEAVRRELFQAFHRQKLVSDEMDILGEFYQTYLRIYSRRAQFELGQFYTPHRLVRAMWALASAALEERALKLSDEEVVVVDPSAGTGTFLTQGLRLAINGNWGERNRKISRDRVGLFTEKFNGLELNPFSKGVADINFLTQLFIHCNEIVASSTPVPSVFETNSYLLDEKPGAIPGVRNPDVKEWLKRWVLSCKAKKSSQYRIVIGNPPWKHPSPALKIEDLKKIIRNKRIPWAYEYENEKLGDVRRCNHGIRDEYMFFFGVADQLVEDNGLICFVTNESWLTGISYRLARKYFLDNYRIKAILRIGPYFKGVQEKAAIVVMEKNASAGRNQEIKFIDWSDANNSDWSYSWIEARLEKIISGSLPKSEWQTLVPQGEQCVLVPLQGQLYGFKQGIYEIEDVVVDFQQGAEPGCTPLYIDTSRSELLKKIRKLFSDSAEVRAELIDTLGETVRGGKQKAAQKVKKARQVIEQEGLEFKNELVSRGIAYLPTRANGNLRQQCYTYFDPRLWDWPRCNRLDPATNHHLWKEPLKLAYRDFSDEGKVEKSIQAFIDDKRRVIAKHSINGGCNVVYFTKDKSTIKPVFRDNINLTHAEWCYYIFAILNSRYSREWNQANPRQPARIPVATEFESHMRKVAALGIKYRRLIEKSQVKALSKTELSQLDKFNSKVEALVRKMAKIDCSEFEEKVLEALEREEKERANRTKKRSNRGRQSKEG
jgi:type I restriction-modification system DNA methylase subunit